MDIVVISHAGGSPYHGPNMRWFFLAKALKCYGVNVSIVSSGYFHKYFKAPTLRSSSETEVLEDVQFYWLKNFRYHGRVKQILNQFWFTIKARLLLKKILKDKEIDIVIASSPHPLVIFPAKRLAELKKAPLVYEVRDLWPLVIKELSGSSNCNPYIWLTKQAERYAIRNADSITSVKPGDIEYFRTEYPKKDLDFTYIPNGFFVEQSSAVIKTKHVKKQANFTIGYVGAVSSYYGLDALIEAVAYLKEHIEVVVVVVGGGEDLERLKNKATKLNCRNINFVGQVPRSEVASYIQSFDVCYVGLKDVKANRFGISCNKIFEYMHEAKPILASYNTEFDPVQMAGCGVTVNAESSSSVLEGIRKLFNCTEAEREEMGLRGKEYFLKNHDFSQVAKIYHSLFDRLKSNGR